MSLGARDWGLGTRGWRLETSGRGGSWGLETREGAHYTRVINRSNNRKPEKPPQNERVSEALPRVRYSGEIMPHLWQA